MRSRLHRTVARKLGGPAGVFVIDETSDGKKGKHTAGVDRQYCGESGKVENCIVSVHLGYARGDFRSLLDGELFLPESCYPDPGNPEVQERRRRVGIPSDVGHVSKPALGLRLLRRALGNGVPGRFVVADEAYGDKPK